MAQRKTPKLDSAGSGIQRVFFEEEESDALKIEKVYTAGNGLLKIEQKHDTRMNLVLPEQLLEVFGEITERKVGKREKSAVIEHLMIEYCKANGAEIIER